MEFLNALFTAAFDNNIVFVQMVGMVSVIVLALRPQDSVRFGLALWAASAVSGIVGWPIYYLLLQPWGLDYLAPMAYLLVSATCVFFVGAVASAMAMCTIVALNACTLAVPLSNAAAGCEFPVGAGTAIGAGMGAFIAVVLFAGVRNRINESQVPAALRGLPISLVTASIMCLAFFGVSGALSGLFV